MEQGLSFRRGSGSTGSPALVLMGILIASAAIAVILFMSADREEPDLVITVIPDIDVRGGGEFRVRLVGAGIDNTNSSENEYVIILKYNITYVQGLSPTLVNRTSIVEITFINPILRSRYLNQILVETEGGGRLVPGGTVTLETRLRIQDLPFKSLRIGTVDSKTIGYDPLSDTFTEPYSGEPVKVTIDVVGIYFED